MNKTLERIIIVLELVLLVVFLFYHLKLGLVRYFDADEFAHLHWSFNFFSGLKPYNDFLYFFPPGFLILLWPLWFFIGKSYFILTAGRVLAFGFFVFLLWTLWLLVKEIKDRKTALLTITILAFLPLPFDKLIEVRPDTAATALGILGMYFLIRGIRQTGVISEGKKPMKIDFYISGLCYGLSLFILPKMAFYVVAAVVITFIFLFLNTIRGVRSHTPEVSKSSLIRIIIFVLLGIAGPLIFTLLFFLWSGNFQKAFYLTTEFASVSTKVLGSKFYMFPSHFFHPNDTYYGYGGISIPLIVNLIIYLIGIVWGIKWAVSFLDAENRQEAIIKLFIPLTYFLNLYAFIKIYPLKHAQYLISFAPFIAFFCADFLLTVRNRLTESTNQSVILACPESILEAPDLNRDYQNDRRGNIFFQIIINLMYLVMLGGIGLTGVKMNNVKINWVDWKTRYNTQKIQEFIPRDEYVFDLVGETLFYKDPYYVCCIPYGQYLEAFEFNLPSVEIALKETKTKYIYLNNEGRLGILPPLEQKYIKNNYKVISQDPYILGRK